MNGKHILWGSLFLFICSIQLHAQTVPTPDHVVVVVMENHDYSDIIGSGTGAPYINSLATDTEGALFTNSTGVTHPSQPNYMYLFSGDDQNVIGDLTPLSFLLPFTSPNLGAELLAAGKTFKGFSEDLPSVGYTGDTYNNYARKHAPWVNWQNGSTNGIPQALNLPFDSFPTNYDQLPTISFVIPNLNDDMHNGTIAQGDAWVQTHMDGYIQWAKTHNSLLILTYDEDDNVILINGPVTTIFVGQMVKAGQYNEAVDHNRVLRTMEDMYGLPHAGSSANPAPITDCWIYKPVSAMTATPNPICQGQSVTVTDQSLHSPTKWNWSFQGGNPSNSYSQTPPAVTYSSAGSQTVTLITSNHMGSDTATLQVTVNPNPVLTLSSDSIFICQGDTAHVTASGAGSFTWLPGSGIVSATGANLLADPSQSASYHVTGTTSGCQGDTATVSVIITPRITPAISISPVKPSACTGTPVTLGASANGGGASPSFQWLVNGTAVGGNSDSFQSSGLSNGDTITCILTSNATCRSSNTAPSNKAVMTVYPSATTGLSTGICPGSSYPFNGQSLTTAGLYTASLTTTHGCDSIVSLTLSIHTPPSVSWSGGTDTEYITGSAVTLTGASPSGGTYTGAGVSSGSFDPAAAGLGIHTLTYTYSDSSGCTDSASRTFVVTVLTSIQMVNDGSDMELYPNPAQESLTIRSDQFISGEVTSVVYDMTGRVIAVATLRQNDKLILSTSAMAEGIYLIRVNVNGKETSRKFTKRN